MDLTFLFHGTIVFAWVIFWKIFIIWRGFNLSTLKVLSMAPVNKGHKFFNYVLWFICVENKSFQPSILMFGKRAHLLILQTFQLLDKGDNITEFSCLSFYSYDHASESRKEIAISSINHENIHKIQIHKHISDSLKTRHNMCLIASYLITAFTLQSPLEIHRAISLYILRVYRTHTVVSM